MKESKQSSRIPFAIAALAAIVSVSAQAEYRCSAPPTPEDQRACELAKQGPDQLREFRPLGGRVRYAPRGPAVGSVGEEVSTATVTRVVRHDTVVQAEALGRGSGLVFRQKKAGGDLLPDRFA
jgi:hypothetical protein